MTCRKGCAGGFEGQGCWRFWLGCRDSGFGCLRSAAAHETEPLSWGLSAGHTHRQYYGHSPNASKLRMGPVSGDRVILLKGYRFNAEVLWMPEMESRPQLCSAASGRKMTSASRLFCQATLVPVDGTKARTRPLQRKSYARSSRLWNGLVSNTKTWSAGRSPLSTPVQTCDLSFGY
jgi:hypothetical protein